MSLISTRTEVYFNFTNFFIGPATDAHTGGEGGVLFHPGVATELDMTGDF